jgi:hypothetical protein
MTYCKTSDTCEPDNGIAMLAGVQRAEPLWTLHSQVCRRAGRVMRTIALLAALLLSACVHRPPAVYGNGDPGVIVHRQLHWVGDPTPAEKHEWEVFHLHPSFDENEVSALRKYKWSIGADFGSTALALGLRAAAFEANPLGWALIPVNYVAYKGIESDLKKSSRYTTWVTPVRVHTGIRYTVATSNVLMLVLRC